jgi:hypothetical protein
MAGTAMIHLAHGWLGDALRPFALMVTRVNGSSAAT